MAAARDHQRIPSLDGLRAISIGFVLLGHLILTLHVRWPSGVLALFDLGALGVRVFFVISGFLITQLLVDEQARTGSISLTRFYFRRTMRIFPPYYAFLIIIVILRRFGMVEAPSNAILHAATYTSNYFPSMWTVGHSWSLSVEEQFYLIWPALVIVLGARRWMWGAVAVLVAAPLLRVWAPSPYARLDLVADSLAIGCVLAGVRARLLENVRFTRAIRSGAIFVGALGAVIVIELIASRPSIMPHWLFQLVLISVQNALIALIVHWSILRHDGAIGRILNSAPFSFVGVISYSIYIWQQPFLNHYVHAPLTTFPLNLAAAFACAIASYYVIERPSLALRKKLDARFVFPRAARPTRRRYGAPARSMQS